MRPPQRLGVSGLSQIAARDARLLSAVRTPAKCR